MINQDILNYINAQLSQGKSRDEISQALLNKGWQARDIQEAFTAHNDPNAGVPVNPNLPSGRELFKEAWAIYRKRYKTLILINLIPALAVIILGAIFGGGIAASSALKVNTAALGITGVIIGVVAAVFLIYLGIWGAVAQLEAIKGQAEGIGWKEAFKRSRKLIGPFFITGLLAGLAVFGGLILLIVPGIIFGLWFSQSGYIVVEEGLKGSEALKKSKFYMKGRIGSVFAKLFYMGIITFALSFILGLMVVFLDSFTAHPEQQYLSVLNNIFSLIWGPVVAVYGYLLYRHLKASIQD